MGKKLREQKRRIRQQKNTKAAFSTDMISLMQDETP